MTDPTDPTTPTHHGVGTLRWIDDSNAAALGFYAGPQYRTGTWVLVDELDELDTDLPGIAETDLDGARAAALAALQLTEADTGWDRITGEYGEAHALYAATGTGPTIRAARARLDATRAAAQLDAAGGAFGDEDLPEDDVHLPSSTRPREPYDHEAARLAIAAAFESGEAQAWNAEQLRACGLDGDDTADDTEGNSA